jgi:SET domain-containing protein
LKIFFQVEFWNFLTVNRQPSTVNRQPSTVKKMLHIPSLYIATSENRGRGVFTSEEIFEDDIIELCPLVLIPLEQLVSVDKTIFYDYYFLLPNGKDACIALGYGSLYNHSTTPNACVVFDLENDSLQMHCIKNIAEGEEILINYQGDEEEGDRTELWFEAK